MEEYNGAWDPIGNAHHRKLLANCESMYNSRDKEADEVTAVRRAKAAANSAKKREKDRKKKEESKKGAKDNAGGNN